MTEVPIDLMQTGGKLLLPGTVAVPPQVGQRGVPPEVLAAAQAGRSGPATPPNAPTTPTPDPTAVPTPPTIDLNEVIASSTVCRCCGWPMSLDHIQPGEHDPRKFRDAVFAGKPFEKRYGLFDGAVIVTYRDLTADEESIAVYRAGIEQRRERLNDMATVAFLTGCRLGLAVTEIRIDTRNYQAEPIPDIKMLDPEERHRALRTWLGADVLYRTTRDHYIRFHSMLDVLMARAGDRSFYAATGSAGV